MGIELLAFLSVGVIAGILAGMFGIGGGVIIVPALIATFMYLGFDENIIISDVTLFSSFYDIEHVYSPIVFTSNVDLLNTDLLENFISSNVSILQSIDANTPFLQNSLNNINNDLNIFNAYNSYDNSSIEYFVEHEEYTVIISIKDQFNSIKYITENVIPVQNTLTTLQANIASCSFDQNNNIVLSGNVIPDSNNETTYYVYATTNSNLTNNEVRELILREYDSPNIISDTISNNFNIVDLSISSIFDIDSNIMNSKHVNYANIHLYATNSNAPSTFDDIDTFTITPQDDSIHVTISSYYSLFYETINITELTFFSTYKDIKVVYTPFALIYGIYVDYSIPLFENFVTSNIPPLDIGDGKPFISKNSVSRFIDISIDSAYRDLDVNTK